MTTGRISQVCQIGNPTNVGSLRVGRIAVQGELLWPTAVQARQVQRVRCRQESQQRQTQGAPWSTGTYIAQKS